MLIACWQAISYSSLLTPEACLPTNWLAPGSGPPAPGQEARSAVTQFYPASEPAPALDSPRLPCQPHQDQTCPPASSLHRRQSLAANWARASPSHQWTHSSHLPNDRKAHGTMYRPFLEHTGDQRSVLPAPIGHLLHEATSRSGNIANPPNTQK